MTTRLLLTRAMVLAGVVSGALLTPGIAFGQEIRVLLLVPPGDVVLAAQTARMERAIMATRGPITVVETLSDADVVVEFTGYQRELTNDGQPIRNWVGEYVVVSDRQVAIQSADRPRQFELMVLGEDGTEDTRAVELFERALSQALGHEMMDEPSGETPTP